MNRYIYQNNPFVVPTDDGKLIEEHFGIASTGDEKLSLARMVAPPQWEEPFQQPLFDEYTLVFRGRKMVEVDDDKVILNPGESILVKAGSRVRYSNPFNEETEYISVCKPAFSPDTVQRES